MTILPASKDLTLPQAVEALREKFAVSVVDLRDRNAVAICFPNIGNLQQAGAVAKEFLDIVRPYDKKNVRSGAINGAYAIIVSAEAYEAAPVQL